MGIRNEGLPGTRWNGTGWPDSEFIKPLGRLRLKWRRLTKDAFRQRAPKLGVQIKRKSKPKQVNQANPEALRVSGGVLWKSGRNRPTYSLRHRKIVAITS